MAAILQIFFNENIRISIKLSINNTPVLFQIMAWHRPGHKPQVMD